MQPQTAAGQRYRDANSHFSGGRKVNMLAPRHLFNGTLRTHAAKRMTAQTGEAIK